jgi:hypothetical protein
MPDDEQAEARLHKLAGRLHDGWEKLHPATEKELDAVRQAAQQYWEHKQSLKREQEESQERQRREQAKPKPQQKKGHSQDIDHSDEHSH